MKYTKKKLLKELKEIKEIIESGEGTSLDALLTLDHLMRLPDSDKLFDDTTKAYAKELWCNAVSMGIKLETPPIIADGTECVA